MAEKLIWLGITGLGFYLGEMLGLCSNDGLVLSPLFKNWDGALISGIYTNGLFSKLLLLDDYGKMSELSLLEKITHLFLKVLAAVSFSLDSYFASESFLRNFFFFVYTCYIFISFNWPSF